MLVFFDVETSDYAPPSGTPATDTKAWPRLVQIGWTCCDAKGRELEAREELVRPNGYTIAPRVVAIHGITTERAARDGRELRDVLSEFSRVVNEADILVAHNLSFDHAVVSAEYVRAELPRPRDRRRHVCTMLGSTDYCELPGKYGKHKWPKLEELHVKLFGEAFSGAHAALEDARACMRCYFRLGELGVVV